MFHIDINSNIPLYEQLRNQIIELVMLGLLKDNDALPSVRSLAKQLGINPNTVSKAYSELEHDKMIYSLAGKGSFLSINPAIIDKYLINKQAEFIKILKELQNLGMKKEELIKLIESEGNI